MMSGKDALLNLKTMSSGSGYLTDVLVEAAEKSAPRSTQPCPDDMREYLNGEWEKVSKRIKVINRLKQLAEEYGYTEEPEHDEGAPLNYVADILERLTKLAIAGADAYANYYAAFSDADKHEEGSYL